MTRQETQAFEDLLETLGRNHQQMVELLAMLRKTELSPWQKEIIGHAEERLKIEMAAMRERLGPA